MNVCFNGCSFTVGEGFSPEQRDEYVYDRLLEKKFGFKRTNIAQGGSSNYKIFMRSADALISGNYNCVITQWTALNRLWLHPGPDSDFFVNDESPDFKYRYIYINPEEKIKLKNNLLMLNGDYHNIIDLVKFTSILKTIAQVNNTKVVFVNGLVHWTDDLVKPIGTNLDKSLSDYSKSILDFDNRDDNEIIKLFQELQQIVSEIDQNLWVNIFDSWIKNLIDAGPDGHHPGIKSNQWMADLLSEYFNKNQIL